MISPRSSLPTLKLWLAFLLLHLLAGRAFSFPQKLGDIDGDGQPTVLDLIAIVNHINGSARLTNELSVFADLNQDGVVNRQDVDLLADAILGVSPLPDLPLDRILTTSPANGESGVSVTRETILTFTQPLSPATSIIPSQFYATFGGRRLLSRIDIASDRRKVSLFYLENIPGSAHIEVTFDASKVTDFAGRLVDADGDGQPGGIALIEFDTLNQTPLVNTIVYGRIFASELAPSGSTNLSVNTPLQGVMITADGLEEQVRAVTDQLGDFRLTNAPAGQFFVHIDGRTLVNLSAGISFPDLNYYPYVGKEWVSVLGGETNIGNIYLPLVAKGTLQTVSLITNTTIVFPDSVLAEHPELDGVTVTVPANSLFSDNGNRGGKVGIAPVPPDRLPGPLPDGLSFPLVITLQTDGPSNFSEPVPVCFPNLSNSITGTPPLPPGAKSALWSFSHEIGQWQVIGPMTVSEDGLLICTDPGVGIIAPGWHGAAPGVTGGGGTNAPGTGDVEPTDNNEPARGKPRDSKKNPGDKVSDPVHLFSGEFRESEEDLRIPGVGFDFVWTRTYRSKMSPLNYLEEGIETINDGLVIVKVIPLPTIQGFFWDFSYNILIAPSGRGMKVNNGDGRLDLFRPVATPLPVLFNGASQPFVYAGDFRFLTMLQGQQNYTMIFEDGMQWHFKPIGDALASGKIASINDRNGNTMTFQYGPFGRLLQVNDTLGRPIKFAYSPQGFLVTITDFSGRMVHYEYYGANEPGGSAGDLKSVTTPAVIGTPNGNDFPNGKTTTYTYSKGFADDNLNHNLLTITDGRRNDPGDPTFGQGPYLANVYSSATDPNDPTYDRVVRQSWGGNTVLFNYLPQTPSPDNDGAVNKTIVNDRMGHVKEFFYDAANRLIMLREYTGQANIVQPVTDSTNRPANKFRPGDPAYFETRWQYNGDDLTTRIDYPNGNVDQFVYEVDLNPTAVATRRGNLRTHTRSPGTHVPGGDQNAITEQFEYLDDLNFVTRHVDGRGNQTLNQYDSHGNLTNRSERISGVVEQFTYNAAGQMMSHVYPDNGSGIHRIDAMTYYGEGPQKGYLQYRVIDNSQLALVTTYEYDAVGNVVRTIDPRGHDTIFAVNALNQVVRETSREVKEGSGIRYQRDFFYDANNNLTRVDIENRDENGVLQLPAHFSTRMDFEILDKLTRKTQDISATQTIVTEYAYDYNRNRTLTRYGEATAGRQTNNVVQVKYDERDLPFLVTRAPGDPSQSTTQFDYDGNKNCVRQTQGLESQPRTTITTFDGFNRKVAVNDAMGNVVSLNYDANGNSTHRLTSGELLDVNGSSGNVRLAETTLGYDPMDRPTNQAAAFFVANSQAPIGDGFAVTRTIYSDNSQVLAVINDNGHGATNHYDSASRLDISTDAKGNTIQYSLDANGNILSKTETDKSDLGTPDQKFVTSFTYDGLDRLTQWVDSSSSTNQIAIDSRGNQVLLIDARGNTTHSTFDGMNRLTATTRTLTDTGDGSGKVTGSITTRQTWDDTSRLTAQIDGNGNATTYVYDALNRTLATIFADTTGQTNGFDPHDNIIVATDANGTVVTNSFDLLNRVIRRDVQAGPGVSAATTFEVFAYDGLSRVVQAQNDASLVTRSYDSLSHVLSEVESGQTSQYAYDGVGNLLQTRYPGGRVITNAFDQLERKKTITDAEGLIAAYDFVGRSRVERRDSGDGTRCDFVYDGIAGIANPAGDFGVREIIRTTHKRISDGGVFDDRTYAWDRMANKVLRQDVRQGSPQLTQNFHYDSVNRLTQSARGPPSAQSNTNSYVFDSVGNRVFVQGGTNAGAYTLSAALPEPADYQLNQYTTTPFDSRKSDADGNLASTIASHAASRSFTYDYRNRLVAFTNAASGVSATYSYDALGRRIQKTVTGGSIQTTHFLHHGWQEIEERDGGGTVVATYVYGLHPDEVLSMRRAGQDYFYHADDLRNVTAVTSAGSVVERYDYADYGAPTIYAPDGTQISTSAIGNPYLFTGHRLDTESGLHFFRTRYLDSFVGRFISRDAAGIWRDSSGLGNGYAFVMNNPWSYVDPWGLDKEKSWLDQALDWLSDGIVDARECVESGWNSFLESPGMQDLMQEQRKQQDIQAFLNSDWSSFSGTWRGLATAGDYFAAWFHPLVEVGQFESGGGGLWNRVAEAYTALRGGEQLFSQGSWNIEPITDPGHLLSAPAESNPWMPGTILTSRPAPSGTYMDMAMASGQIAPGSWGTYEHIPDVNFVRNDLAVTPEFKPDIAYVQRFLVPEGIQIQEGIAGPQSWNGIIYPGGASQVRILNPSDKYLLIPIQPRRPIE